MEVLYSVYWGVDVHKKVLVRCLGGKQTPLMPIDSEPERMGF